MDAEHNETTLQRIGRAALGALALTLVGLPTVAYAGLPLWTAPAVGLGLVWFVWQW